MDILDTTKIETVEDLNNTNFEKYIDKTHKTWVRNIKYPISQDELTRLYLLSKSENSKFLLNNSMGDLYINTK